MAKTRRPCAPSKADWYLEVIYGRTFCKEHGYLCESSSCQYKYGTSTDYNYAFYKGERPGNRPAKSLMPPLHYEIERTVKRCPNEGDEATCRFCGTDITFTHGWPHWVPDEGNERCDQAEYNEHEPTDEYHE